MPECALQKWMAYYRIEPWGEERADWRIAQLCVMVAQAFGVKDAKLSHYMLNDEPQTTQMSEANMRASAESFFGVLKKHG